MRAFINAWYHFRSRDKDGGHTIRSAIVESWATQNFMGLCSEAELWLIEFLHSGNTHFQPCLFLWPWLWLTDLHIQTWPVLPGDIPDVWKWTSYVKSCKSYRITSRECVHLVTRGHFRSRDKDGGHTVRSAIEPHAARKRHSSIFDRTGITGDRSFILRK